MISFENERFHLRNEFFSYVMEIARGKYLLHRYWGRPLKEFRDSAPLQKVDRAFSGQLADFENERTYSLDVLPQEYPVRGRTDYRISAYAVELENGTNISELNYAAYKIFDSKPALKGLPASFGDGQTLEIELWDACRNFTVFLSYTVFADSPILARSARFVNTSDKKIKIRNAASAAIEQGAQGQIPLYGGGGIGMTGNAAADAFKMICLGANGVFCGKILIQLLGCVGNEQGRCNACNTGKCPTGICTQNPRLVKRLDVDRGAQRIVDYVLAFDAELRKLMAPIGNSSLPVGRSDALVSTDKAIADKLGIQYVC